MKLRQVTSLVVAFIAVSVALGMEENGNGEPTRVKKKPRVKANVKEKLSGPRNSMKQKVKAKMPKKQARVPQDCTESIEAVIDKQVDDSIALFENDIDPYYCFQTLGKIEDVMLENDTHSLFAKSLVESMCSEKGLDHDLLIASQEPTGNQIGCSMEGASGCVAAAKTFIHACAKEDMPAEGCLVTLAAATQVMKMKPKVRMAKKKVRVPKNCTALMEASLDKSVIDSIALIVEDVDDEKCSKAFAKIGNFTFGYDKLSQFAKSLFESICSFNGLDLDLLIAHPDFGDSMIGCSLEGALGCAAAAMVSFNACWMDDMPAEGCHLTLVAATEVMGNAVMGAAFILPLDDLSVCVGTFPPLFGGPCDGVCKMLEVAKKTTIDLVPLLVTEVPGRFLSVLVDTMWETGNADKEADKLNQFVYWIVDYINPGVDQVHLNDIRADYKSLVEHTLKVKRFADIKDYQESAFWLNAAVNKCVDLRRRLSGNQISHAARVPYLGLIGSTCIAVYAGRAHQYQQIVGGPALDPVTGKIHRDELDDYIATFKKITDDATRFAVNERLRQISFEILETGRLHCMINYMFDNGCLSVGGRQGRIASAVDCNWGRGWAAYEPIRQHYKDIQEIAYRDTFLLAYTNVQLWELMTTGNVISKKKAVKRIRLTVSLPGPFPFIVQRIDQNVIYRHGPVRDLYGVPWFNRLNYLYNNFMGGGNVTDRIVSIRVFHKWSAHGGGKTFGMEVTSQINGERWVTNMGTVDYYDRTMAMDSFDLYDDERIVSVNGFDWDHHIIVFHTIRVNEAGVFVRDGRDWTSGTAIPGELNITAPPIARNNDKGAFAPHIISFAAWYATDARRNSGGSMIEEERLMWAIPTWIYERSEFP